jgi:beta-lactamase class A
MKFIRTNKYYNNGLFFLLGIIITYTCTLYASQVSESDGPIFIRKKVSGSYIAPILLSYDNEKFHVHDALFESTITKYINQKIKKEDAVTISFYFKDLTNGEWAGVNENQSYSLASLMKVPIMIALFKQAESNPLFLKKKLHYDGKENLNDLEYYKSKNFIIPGHEYTILSLIQYMIMYSDNNATILLLTTTSVKDFDEIFTDLGLPLPENESLNTADYMSAKLYSRLFRVLYNSTYLNEQYSSKALQILTSPDFPDGISSLLPKTILVANKFGERSVTHNGLPTQYKELHDCGIVYLPNKPYLICVMTKGSDFSKLQTIIQDISKITYDRMILH